MAKVRGRKDLAAPRGQRLSFVSFISCRSAVSMSLPLPVSLCCTVSTLLCMSCCASMSRCPCDIHRLPLACSLAAGVLACRPFRGSRLCTTASPCSPVVQTGLQDSDSGTVCSQSLAPPSLAPSPPQPISLPPSHDALATLPHRSATSSSRRPMRTRRTSSPSSSTATACSASGSAAAASIRLPFSHRRPCSVLPQPTCSIPFPPPHPQRARGPARRASLWRAQRPRRRGTTLPVL